MRTGIWLFEGTSISYILTGDYIFLFLITSIESLTSASVYFWSMSKRLSLAESDLVDWVIVNGVGIIAWLMLQIRYQKIFFVNPHQTLLFGSENNINS